MVVRAVVAVFQSVDDLGLEHCPDGRDREIGQRQGGAVDDCRQFAAPERGLAEGVCEIRRRALSAIRFACYLA